MNIIWSDIQHDLNVVGNGDIEIVENIQAVKTSITNIIRTSQGERVMRRGFGSSINKAVFENIDSQFKDVYITRLKRDITSWEPRVLLQSIEMTTVPHKNRVSIEMVFSIKGYDNIFKYELEV